GEVHVLARKKSNSGEQGGSCHSGCASVGLSALWPSSLFITACHFLVLEYGELIGYLITFAIWVFIATLSYFVFRSLLRRTCKSGSVNSAVMNAKVVGHQLPFQRPSSFLRWISCSPTSHSSPSRVRPSMGAVAWAY